MTFGKYENRPIRDIPPSYLRWVLRDVTDLDWRLRRAIEEQLGEAPRWKAAAPAAPPPSEPVIEQIIRTWHRTMALKFHPDRGGSLESMIAVNTGAELLRDLAKQITEGAR